MASCAVGLLVACGPNQPEASVSVDGLSLENRSSTAAIKTSAQNTGCDTPNPQAILAGLLDGNLRFVQDGPLGPNRSMVRVSATAERQTPIATIVSCSDSRVPAEIIFDQGIGDLFMVRTAGQVATFASYGSIEFAVKVLGTRLIVVLGHTRCGAVAAAVNNTMAGGHIDTLVQAIAPAAEAVNNLDGDRVDNAVRENVRRQVQTLRDLQPILSEAYRKGEIDIIGAVYDIATGLVSVLD